MLLTSMRKTMQLYVVQTILVIRFLIYYSVPDWFSAHNI
jgi:hypothetical protein